MSIPLYECKQDQDPKTEKIKDIYKMLLHTMTDHLIRILVQRTVISEK